MDISLLQRHHRRPFFSPPLATVSYISQLLLFFLLFPIASAGENLYNLIYKGCARGGAASPPAVAAVASSLVSQASSSKFYKTTTSTTNTGQSVTGLFQCRGDLSYRDCAACVGHALPLWSEQCGPTSAAARVQLTGCYAFYQVAGFPQVPGTQMLFKTCSTNGGGSDFLMKRDTAMSNLESGVSGGGGFYATSYGSVYAMAQCEGDLSTSDCGQCVTQAVQRVQVECGGAAGGQVYLDKCYVSYNYYGNGVPKFVSAGGSGGGGGGQNTAKTVAIVVGAAAAAGFLIICLLFANSLRKNKDDF